MVAYDRTIEDIEAVEADRELKKIKREQAARNMRKKR